jgi:hypothetical protein
MEADVCSSFGETPADKVGVANGFDGGAVAVCSGRLLSDDGAVFVDSRAKSGNALGACIAPRKKK